MLTVKTGACRRNRSLGYSPVRMCEIVAAGPALSGHMCLHQVPTPAGFGPTTLTSTDPHASAGTRFHKKRLTDH